ncbi:UNVERIFIED_CONTAM: hypothetical protein Sangu_1009300 [Sesamum angustifolium]|uniref:Retrotransposon gag domain-containing protein n=1 Tax=Sesamum angustifolium TaxID=2727405 RepID=A0AAW2PGH9_9LAMI
MPLELINEIHISNPCTIYCFRTTPCLNLYGGARDTKEIENFLFDMEQYFLAANIEDEARKANQVRLDTWALLREAIQEQLFLENVEYNARRALRKLEHTGSVRDYVKAFSALMLDIRDMSEKDKLFTFMKGLKPWARLQLQRQRVIDLGAAMATAERLIDLNPTNQRDRQTTASPMQNKPGRPRSFRSNSNKGGGDRKPQAQSSSQGSSSRNKPQEHKQGAPQKSSGCFLCDGPHRYRDCLKKQLLNALATFTDKASPSKPMEPRPPVTANKIVPTRAGKTAPTLTRSHPGEEAQPRNPRKTGLVFVNVKIHGKPILAMIDNRATNNYLASAEVERLGLVLEKGVGRVKAINSAAQPIAGVAKSVLIKVEQASGPIPSVIKKLLKDFEDVMPNELPRKLLSKRAVDHEIELVLGTKPPARAPYRTSQSELVELRKH